MLAKGKYVVIPAFCLTTGKPRLFKTDHGDGLTRHNQYPIKDVALASSAAPIYLSVVELPSPVDGRLERYCDGSVFANHPALLALSEALFHLSASPTAISLLSVSTPRSSLAEVASASGFFRRHMLSRGWSRAGKARASRPCDSRLSAADCLVGGRQTAWERSIAFLRTQQVHGPTARLVCEAHAPHDRRERACADADDPPAGPHVAARVSETRGRLGLCAFTLAISLCLVCAKIIIFAQTRRRRHECVPHGGAGHVHGS